MVMIRREDDLAVSGLRKPPTGRGRGSLPEVHAYDLEGSRPRGLSANSSAHQCGQRGSAA